MLDDDDDMCYSIRQATKYANRYILLRYYLIPGKEVFPHSRAAGLAEYIVAYAAHRFCPSPVLFNCMLSGEVSMWTLC